MNVALDTNRYVDFCRGVTEVLEVLRKARTIYVPFVTLGELRAGFRCGQKSRENERVLTQFLNSRRVRILYADEQTTHHYAALFRELRERGMPIPTNDLWIAALVVQHDLMLFARDQHFDALPQIPRI